MKLYFKDGINGTLQDWTGEQKLSISSSKRKIESRSKGEAGVIVYDKLSITLGYVSGSLAYQYFSGDLSSKTRYIFELHGVKEDKSPVKLFEGLVDFSSLEFNEDEKKVSFNVVDKLSALSILSSVNARESRSLKTQNPPWLTPLNWAAGEYYQINIGNTPSVIIEIIKYTGSPLTASHVNVGNTVPIFEAGEILSTFDGEVERLLFAKDRYFYNGNYPGENDTWLGAAEDSDNLVGGYRIDSTASDAFLISNPNVKLRFYKDEFYGGDITNKITVWDNGILKTRVSSLNAQKIIKLIYTQVWSGETISNRSTGFSLSYSYWRQTIKDNPFNLHPLEALKMLAATIQSYVFVNTEGSLVIQKRTDLSSNTVRALNPLTIKNKAKKYFWDKLADAVTITAKGSTASGTATYQKASGSSNRNELKMQIAAPNTILDDSAELSAYAYLIAGEILNFYGKRHWAVTLQLRLTDTMFSWDLLDLIYLDGEYCFIETIDISEKEKYCNISLVSVNGYNYNFEQARAVISKEKYYSQNSSSGSNTNTNVNVDLTAEAPLSIEASAIRLDYEDNLKKSTNNKLDTTQPIKTTSTPQFARIGIGGIPDATVENAFLLKVYGNTKVTNNLVIDGSVYIGGDVNRVNVQDFDVDDHAIRLNKNGNNTTALNGGIEMLGADNVLLGSIKYNGVSWVSDINIDLSTGKTFKINNVDVLSSTTLGSSVVGSSLTSIGTLNHDLNIANTKVYKINSAEVLSATTLGAAVVNSSLTKVGTIVTGVWNGTAIADLYIASAVNWNDANSKKHTHANIAVLNATTESFTTALKTSYDSTASASHSHTNIAHLNAVDQSLAATASVTFSKVTLASGELLTAASTNLVLNPLGKSVVPKAAYDVNLGSATLKYLSIYGAELAVGQLVSQSTIATIGGRILIGRTTSLIADMNNPQTTIDVKHNNLTSGDRIYLEANGNIEFMAVTSSASAITGGYRYSVSRNLDGSGANSWNSGDAVFNTGTTGSGFIDLYSINGLKNTQYGPAIVGNVRNSSTYNDWSEVFAIGNLNGLYGYNADTYGVGLGKYSTDASYLLADAANGIRIRKGSTTLAQWDVSGNILVGEAGAGKSNVYITAGAVQLRNNTTALITLNADGIAAFAGNISSTATITGGTIQTALIGQRIVLNEGNGNTLKIYASNGEAVTLYSKDSNVTGDNCANFNKEVSAPFFSAGDSSFQYFSMRYGELKLVNTTTLFRVGSTGIITRMWNADFDSPETSNSFLKWTGAKFTWQNLTTSNLAALTTSKIAVTDASGYLAASSINSSELFTPVYGAMRQNDNTTTVGSTTEWVKYTGFISAAVKNCSVANSALTVSQAGKYLISYTITYKSSYNTGNLILIDVCVNNVNSANEKGKKSTKIRDTSEETISNTFELTLAVNDVIDLRLYSGDTDVLTFVYANLLVNKISN